MCLCDVVDISVFVRLIVDVLSPCVITVSCFGSLNDVLQFVAVLYSL